jgi:hypothetical protein
MPFLGDPRRRTVILLASGALLFFALLGALQAFNTSNVGFLNPDTSGETLVFTALTVLVFLLLITMLVMLFRNIMKLYVGQSSTTLGARLRTRMVLGAGLIAITPAAFMFLFSFLLMNRSIDRWFSPNTSELREDSTRVVLELAQYVTNNARVEAESIAASGAADRDLQVLRNELTAHRITLAGGFALAYDKDMRLLASFQAPRSRARPVCFPGCQIRPMKANWEVPFRCMERSQSICFPRRSATTKQLPGSMARITLWECRRPLPARRSWWPCPCRRDSARPRFVSAPARRHTGSSFAREARSAPSSSSCCC